MYLKHNSHGDDDGVVWDWLRSDASLLNSNMAEVGGGR